MSPEILRYSLYIAFLVLGIFAMIIGPAAVGIAAAVVLGSVSMFVRCQNCGRPFGYVGVGI